MIKMCVRALLGAAVLSAFALTAAGHELDLPGPHNRQELLRSWSFEPGIVIPLVISALLYVIGTRRLAMASPRSIRKVDIGYFASGWMALIVALISPIHPWGSVLFSAHMTQHEILMLIAAPLLVLARPLVPFLWALPRGWARQLATWSKTGVWSAVWHTLTNPFVA